MRRSHGYCGGIRRHLCQLSLLAALVAPALAPAAEPAQATDPIIDDSVRAIASDLDERVLAVLEVIDGTGRRLLALRSYLRSREHLGERWSWTQDQITAFEGSPEYRALQAEVERVREAFTRENPGFDLWVNPQVRSLDRQLDSWNSNESVRAAAEELLAAVREKMPAVGPDAARSEQVKVAIAQLLMTHTPSPTPSVAAPGLSPHGQMRAIDFQVHRDGQVVAGPKIATIAQDWDQAGWTARLDAAVRAASNRFVGPLATPREPWHYTYTPDAVAAQ
jgi:hypothetical protein